MNHPSTSVFSFLHCPIVISVIFNKCSHRPPPLFLNTSDHKHLPHLLVLHSIAERNPKAPLKCTHTYMYIYIHQCVHIDRYNIECIYILYIIPQTKQTKILNNKQKLLL